MNKIAEIKSLLFHLGRSVFIIKWAIKCNQIPIVCFFYYEFFIYELNFYELKFIFFLLLKLKNLNILYISLLK